MERPPMEKALSTDVVMDVVMSHLKVRDLLSCRKVSKFWNKAASSVLRRRSTMIKEIQEVDELTELQECMEQNSDFPFAGLNFDQPWKMNFGPAMDFFRNYGARFTRLHLNTLRVIRLHALVPFIHYLPRLSILELAWSDLPYPQQIELSEFAAPEEDVKVLNLQSVRILRFCYSIPEVNADALREILTAASPSLQIECNDAEAVSLRILKSAGKLQAISSIKFRKDRDNDMFEFTSGLDVAVSTDLRSLTELHFNVGGCLSMDGLKTVLFSSQHTLKKLKLDGKASTLGQLWNQFPVFDKLTKLTLSVEIGFCRKFFFRGRHGHKFPSLKELNLDIGYSKDKVEAKLSDGLLIVPTVTRIKIEGYVSEDGIKQLARSFPNVIEIGISFGYYSGEAKASGDTNCGSNPFELWSVREFKFLEKLTIRDLSIKQPTKNYVHMDSFLTGIPVGICENLRKKNKLSLINSEFNEVLRDNPNLLQLSNLKELIVFVELGTGCETLPKDVPFMSMVSLWYAIEMIPNLRVKFVYEHFSPLPDLEPAFQLVQDFIQLEPFFY